MTTMYLLQASCKVPVSFEDILNTEFVEQRFKVQGENRIVAVVNGPVDEVVSNVKLTPDIDIQCTPLIPYEKFARQTLGVKDSEFEVKADTPPFDPKKEIFWLHFFVDHKGMTHEKMLENWHEEGVLALSLIHGGMVPLKLYKCVAMREVHLFIQMEAAAMDKTSFELPIMKSMGDQVNIITKSVRLLE